MDHTAERIFNYLRDLIYNPSQAKLNVEELNPDFKLVGEGLLYFGKLLGDQRDLAKALARGDLSTELPPPDNELAAPLKALHASLKTMTWQSQQVAKGDYQQRIDFMGEFSEAFNTMTVQLDSRQKALEEEIAISQQKTAALEESNKMLTSITFNIPQLIIVVDEKTNEVLYTNYSAIVLLETDETFLDKVIAVADENEDKLVDKCYVEFTHLIDEKPHFYYINLYQIHWKNQKAKAYVLTDISLQKELATYAYEDTLTKLHNRHSGMMILKTWLEEKRNFCLCFADLDNLKFVNDKFGHSEGDEYILSTAKYLRKVSEGAVACRLGGDEFMILVPEIAMEDLERKMHNIGVAMEQEAERSGKEYHPHISTGIVAVTPDNTMSSSELLGLADERMYTVKRLHKQQQMHKQNNIP